MILQPLKLKRPAIHIHFNLPIQHSMAASSAPWAPETTTQANRSPSTSPISSRTLCPESRIDSSPSETIIPDEGVDENSKNSSEHTHSNYSMNTGKEKEAKSNHNLRPQQIVPLHHLYHISGAYSPAFSLAEREELAYAAANPSSPVKSRETREWTNEELLEQYTKEMESATWCGFDLENEELEAGLQKIDHTEIEGKVEDGSKSKISEKEVEEGQECKVEGCAREKCDARYGPIVQGVGQVLTEGDGEEIGAAAHMELMDEDD